MKSSLPASEHRMPCKAGASNSMTMSPNCRSGTNPSCGGEQHSEAAKRNTTLANDAIDLLSVFDRSKGRRSPAAAATSPSSMLTGLLAFGRPTNLEDALVP